MDTRISIHQEQRLSRIVARILLLALAACLGCAPRGRELELEWHPVSGKWQHKEGAEATESLVTYGRGDLETAGDSSWRNYTFTAELQFRLLFPETHYGDAGLTIRTADAEPGVDSYRGYYVGLRPDDQMLLFGRADYGWRSLATARMLQSVRPGAWYRLSVTARDCTFDVAASEVGSTATSLHYVEPGCIAHGAVGLRSFYTQASWRNLHLRPLP